MSAVRVVGSFFSFAVLLCLGCSDPGTTTPSDPLPDVGPVRSLALTVTPNHLPHTGGSVDVEVRATTDPGMRLAGDSVRLILIIEGREAGNPLALDINGVSQQRLFFSTPATVRVTGGDLMVERAVTLDGLPPPPPPSPVPPPSVPTPIPIPTPTPALDVSLLAAPTNAEINKDVVLTATVTPLDFPPGTPTTVTAYEWDVDGDGVKEHTSSTNTFMTQYATIGKKNARVTAHVGTVTGVGQAEVTVSAPSLHVSLTASPGPYTVGSTVTFTATMTTTQLPPPTDLTWEWDEDGDGVADAVVANQPSPQSRNILLAATTPPATPRIIRVTVKHPATNRSATTTISISVS
jgi:hypothetical protein